MNSRRAGPYPPYSYVPGKFPHPTRDPEGHSFGASGPGAQGIGLKRWSEAADYRRGIDLFDRGYYWEAHEAWESLWHAVNRQGSAGDFLKGLIALAAAGVKAREGSVHGVRQHGWRAKQLFDGLQTAASGSETVMGGMRLAELAGHADCLEKAPERIINTDSAPVVRVMPFQLGSKKDSARLPSQRARTG